MAVATRVTVPMVALNCESVVEATLQGVLSRDYPHLEDIVDGGARDRTVEKLMHVRDCLSYFVSQPAHATYMARHAAGRRRWPRETRCLCLALISVVWPLREFLPEPLRQRMRTALRFLFSY